MVLGVIGMKMVKLLGEILMKWVRSKESGFIFMKMVNLPKP